MLLHTQQNAKKKKKRVHMNGKKGLHRSFSCAVSERGGESDIVRPDFGAFLVLVVAAAALDILLVLVAAAVVLLLLRM